MSKPFLFVPADRIASQFPALTNMPREEIDEALKALAGHGFIRPATLNGVAGFELIIPDDDPAVREAFSKEQNLPDPTDADYALSGHLASQAVQGGFLMRFDGSTITVWTLLLGLVRVANVTESGLPIVKLELGLLRRRGHMTTAAVMTGIKELEQLDLIRRLPAESAVTPPRFAITTAEARASRPRGPSGN